VTPAGVDIGGTKCLGILLRDGEVVASARRPTPSAEDLPAVIADLLDELGPWDTLGVGAPGLVTLDGVVRASPNLTHADEFPLRALLEARLARPVVVANDATVAALAEWRHGAGRGTRDMWMVTLGTGIGGGLVQGGRLQFGARGYAGEIGHMVVQPDGIPCRCGRRGCWERYASGSGLANLAGGMHGEEVVARAAAGEPAALEVVARFARWVGIGLSNLANMTDPDAIVIGGGLVEAADTLMGPIRAAFADALYASDHRELPDLRVAQLGERAGAVGAALLPAELRAGITAP
jgi:glucokinase